MESGKGIRVEAKKSRGRERKKRWKGERKLAWKKTPKQKIEMGKMECGGAWRDAPPRKLKEERGTTGNEVGKEQKRRSISHFEHTYTHDVSLCMAQ